MFQYDGSLAIKYSLTFGLFGNTIRSIGSEKQQHFAEEVESGEVSFMPSAFFALRNINIRN